MHLQHRASGLVVASDKPPVAVKPPEHPVRQVIRDALVSLSENLGQFEQTTHGCMGPFNIEALAEALVGAYKVPGAFSISELAQHIDGFVGKET